MARKILQDTDFGRTQIQNVVLQILGSNPSSPEEGLFYYNSALDAIVWYDGTTWINPRSRDSHTGTQLASTISNFDAAVRLNRLDQMAAPTGDVSMGTHKLTNVATPTADSDAATKGYVDAAVNGTDWKNSVRMATTANIALTGLQTLDGITGAANDRVLVKNQTAGQDNGLYEMRSGAWVRTTDADSNAEVTPNLAVFVEEGSTQADTQWRITTNGPIVLGTTAIAFGQIGAGSSYTGDAGVIVSGNVISLDPAVAVRKFAANVGAGATVAINHNLNTLDVAVQVFEIATGATVECEVTRTSVNQVTLDFADAVDADDYRVVVHG